VSSLETEIVEKILKDSATLTTCKICNVPTVSDNYRVMDWKVDMKFSTLVTFTLVSPKCGTKNEIKNIY